MTTAKRKGNPVAPGVEAACSAPRPSPSAETDPLSPSDAVPSRLAPVPHNNLALPRSPLIGRDHETAVVQNLLLQEQIGLLTLTGPGGIGKTRLAMQVAVNVLDHFVDGVYFVSLAPISDPDLVSATIAQTLSVRESAGRSMQESLQEYLRDKQLLLVLDNFEQILPAASVVSSLLTECRRLKVLVTSRATLHLYGEQEFPVPPLALPDAKHLASTSQSEFAAIDLFCQRARAVKPDFVLTANNAADIAKICIGLDGLPLAIELAAARIKLFSPSALLARLDQRLSLLTGGAHDLPTRQRTLRDEIAWSYNLLVAEEQTLFRRLAVFVGGFTLEAAQSVGKANGNWAMDVVDAVATLVDHNLVKALEGNGDEPRFGMLETIREFGLEQLEASGEAETIRRRHADFFLAWAEATAALFEGANQALVIARLTLDYANLRLALTWSQQDANRTEMALRLATALRNFWMVTGAWREGRHWFEGVLANTPKTDLTLVRAQALLEAGGFAVMQEDRTAAYLPLEEGLAIATELDAKRLMISALTNLAFVARGQGNGTLGVARLTQALVISRELGDKHHIAESLIYLGNFARHSGEYARARPLYEEGLTLFQELDDRFNIADTLSFLGQLAQQEGNYRQAETLFRDSLRGWRALGNTQWKGVAECLEGLARGYLFQQQWIKAAHLLSAAEALRYALAPFSRNPAEDAITTLSTQLDEATFAAAWDTGHALTPEQAIEYALALPEIIVWASASLVSAPALPTPPTYPAGLTAREVEVLRLLAQGLTYIQIAEQLIVSRRTINAHVSSIYSKLEVKGRAAATRFAAAHHLL